jgi:estrone sulfotransferase
MWKPGRRPAKGPAHSARPTIHDDDLFLVSYPKSGNTWMRFLLANLLCDERDGTDGEPIDFHTAVRYVPEYELHADEVNSAPRPRILKSHTTYDARLPRVVYIVRDPRDAYVSYYHYMRKRLTKDTDFSSFIRMDGLHPCHWHEHVAGWIDRPNVLVIRYEDMLADTAAQVRRLVAYRGGRSFTQEQIAHAVVRSSFSQMKQIERRYGRPFQNEQQRRRSTPFMRTGRAGAWTEHFTPDDHELLISRMGLLMDRLGYDTNYPQTTKAQTKSAA